MKKSIAAACLGWMFSSVDIVLLILFQHEVAQALHVGVQSIRIAIGVGLLGSALGGVVFSQLGDRYGRVRALSWCVILYSLSTAGMALAPNLAVLMAMRFISGVGTGGEWSVGFALIAEIAPRTGRGKLGGLVAGMFNLGTFLAVILFQARLGWRAAFGVMALPAIYAVWLRSRVPESPVWLAWQASRGADAALEARLRRAPISMLFQGRLLPLTLKMTLIFTLMNFAFYSFSTTFMNYLQEPSGTGGLGLDVRAQLPYQVALNSVGLIATLLAGLVSDRLGRRLSYSLLCLFGGLGYLLLHLVTRGASGSGSGVPSGLLLILCMISGSYGINGVIGTLTSELFPTHVRSTGPGFCQNIGKGIGGLAGPPLAGALVGTLGYPLVMALPGVFLFSLAGLIWTLPAVGGREVKAVEDDSYLAAGGT